MAKSLDDKIKCLQGRVGSLFQALVDDYRDDLEDLDIDPAKFEAKLKDYSLDIQVISSLLSNAKKTDLDLIVFERLKASDHFVWLLCHMATTLHKAGVIPHIDDLFQRELVRKLDKKLFKLDDLMRQKYKWLPPIDVKTVIKARDNRLIILNLEHSAEWK